MKFEYSDYERSWPNWCQSCGLFLLQKNQDLVHFSFIGSEKSLKKIRTRLGGMTSLCIDCLNDFLSTLTTDPKPFDIWLNNRLQIPANIMGEK